LTVFPDQEAIISESEAIIRVEKRFSRRRLEAISGNIGEAENRGKRVLVHGRGQARDRIDAMAL
jgi:hypothetical protein